MIKKIFPEKTINAITSKKACTVKFLKGVLLHDECKIIEGLIPV